jgi:NAD(P)-dependent dehydrogenase (short-subunit alcohol dehydrogenase family)
LEILQENPKAILINCNVANFKQVEDAVVNTINTFGTLNIALNNAGITGEPSKVGDMTEDAWLKVVNINLNGVFNCMRHELNQMAKQKCGSIINISSILGKVGFATSSHYVAAKHGVIGLTQTAALEYATEGIRINAICPGFIETTQLEKGGITYNPEEKQHIIDLHPMKRLGKSNEIATAFLFLASNENSFMTGTTLEIEGGYLAQ